MKIEKPIIKKQRKEIEKYLNEKPCVRKVILKFNQTMFLIAETRLWSVSVGIKRVGFALMATARYLPRLFILVSQTRIIQLLHIDMRGF